MRSTEPTFEEALALAARVDGQFRPVWDGRPPTEQAALARYFLPHRSAKPTLVPTRPRLVKWYCPFASQREFPSGHRYCINVYTGCAHQCVYCYAMTYEPDHAGAKQRFEQLLAGDMDDLEHFDVPPAPVHLSNSTDPFQPLEQTTGHTRCALEQILAHRKRFTTVTILTKNPLRPVTLGYIDLFKALGSLPSNHPRHDEFARKRLPGFVVEVSLAFWREEARAAYDPGAPSVEARIEGLRALHEAGIPLVLRIDPLFPRSPLAARPSKTMGDFGLPEPQTLDDLENLVAFAKAIAARHVVYSPAKIVQPRRRKLGEMMRAMRGVYEAMAAPAKLVFHGGSWRLPDSIARAEVVRPFLDTCRDKGMAAKYCKQNLIETP